MKHESDSIPRTQAGRELGGLSQKSTDKLWDAEMLYPAPGQAGSKISRESVDALKARMKHQIPTDRLMLRCPKNPDEHGASLYFSPRNAEKAADINEVNHYLDETGRSRLKYIEATKDKVSFTGYWECTDEDADKLVREGGVILGTVAGFVHDAAEVLDLAMTIPYRNRKVFCVRPLHGEELAPWLGFLPSKDRGPRLIEPQ